MTAARRWIVVPIGLLFLLVSWGAGAVQAWEWAPVTDDRLLNADKDGSNWLNYHRTYNGWRYSPLNQINTQTVNKLVPKWMLSLGAVGDQEAHPIVNNGAMLVTVQTLQKGTVLALDAKSGALLWKYERGLPEDLTAFSRAHPHNRAVGVYKDKVFVVTLDAYVIALDAKTGTPVWQTQVADYKDGYYLNIAPLVVKGKVIVGPSGPGEMGIRGFAVALDAESGRELWRRYFVPGPGEPGHDTWGGDSWKYGGAPIWITPTYDPEQNLIFFGTGNPGPFIAQMRPGDNLYSSSVVAVNADTGQIKWYYQYVPNDAWDFDTMSEHLVLNLKKNGKEVPAVVNIGKIGFYYTVDRQTGKVVSAVPFANNVDWARGVDLKTGRPIENPGKRPEMGGEFVGVCPSLLGTKGWAHMSYNPQTNLLYVPAAESCMRYAYLKELKYERGKPYVGVKWEFIKMGENSGFIRALDPNTGKRVWEYPNRSPYVLGGTLTTAGGLVFFSNMEGEITALDAKTGQKLWGFNAGTQGSAAPVTYTVDGKQYLAIVMSGKTRTQAWFAAEPKMQYLKDYPFGGVLIVFGLAD